MGDRLTEDQKVAGSSPAHPTSNPRKGSAPVSLDNWRDKIVAAFARAGHPIRAPIRITVRPGLPVAATTFRSGAGFQILLSDHVLDEGAPPPMLLAHEIGHVQRMDAEHPSHDDDAISAAYEAVGPLAFPYQERILHHVINYTQDLYADPLSFRVARELGILDAAHLDALIAGFTNDEPYDVVDPRERRWDQCEDMVGNARAIALARLAGATGALAKAQAAQDRYLTRIAPDIAREAGWFQRALDDLPEDTTRERFTRHLVAYARRFVATAEG